MTSTTRITTAEQLLQKGDIGPCELVKGELIMMTPAGGSHGDVTAHIVVQLGAFVEAHDLGTVLTADPGFILGRNPDSVRAPDVAFIVKGRELGQDAEGYFVGAPDVAVEVLSPSETASRFAEKLDEYMAAGTRAVWAVDPRRKSVTVYTAGSEPHVLHGDDRLSGGDILPGFELRVAEVFAGRLREAERPGQSPLESIDVTLFPPDLEAAIKAGQLRPEMNFSQRVWALTAQIPAGRVTTYGELARRMGTLACRAVGSSLNRNPYAPIVPCHRVVGSDGSLTGFFHGIEAKRQLLEREGVPMKGAKVDLARALHTW